MKTAAIHHSTLNAQPKIPYPNAATRKELVHKFLDLLLMGAMGAGLAVSLLFMLVIL